jgi:hypothetical protein
MRFDFGKLALAAALALSISAPARAWEMLDANPGTKQIVHDGSAVYALKDNGNIWMFSGGRWQQIDNGVGTRQIAADGGRVYAMKDDGRVYRLSYGQWSAIGSKGSRQMAAAGKDLYTLENNDDVFMFWHGDGQWRKVDNGTRTTMIAADDRNGLFVLKNSGQIFRHLGNARFEMFDNGTSMISASAGVLYVLKSSGQLFRHNGGWGQIDDGQNTTQVAGDGVNCSVLKNDGTVWTFRNEQWLHSFTQGGVRQIAARADEVVALRQDGILIARQGGFASDIRVQNFDQLYNK